MEDLDGIVPPEARAMIGTSLEAVTLPDEISSSDVRRYINATGDRHPLWLDDDYARAAGYRGRVVPPEFVLTLSWRLLQMGERTGMLWADVAAPHPYHQQRNAGTTVEWLEPVRIGDRISITRGLRDITVRRGRAGIGIYVKHDSTYANQDGVVVRQHQTTVWLESRVGSTA